MKKVLTPTWWDKKQFVGFTDCVDTFCCCTTPSWFVEVPECEYAGYFKVKDLTVID